MNNHFINIRLGEIGKVSMCKRILKNQTSETEKVPFYKISTFGSKADTFISFELYSEYKKKYSYPKKGDILISASGTIGKTVIFNGEDSYFQDSNIVWIDNDELAIINKYLYYFYQINSWTSTNGSTIKRLYNDDLRNIIIHYPNIYTQQKIAKVLSTLDAKIELNNRINKELEAMAKTLYDYWFVQFDFPHANNKPYKSSGGKMIYNEELKREIPEDWEVDSLWNIANFFNGLAMQKHRPTNENYLRVIKIREMNEGFSDGTEFASADVPKEAIIENGDILFSWSATLDVKMWSNGKGALNQHIFKVTSDKYPKVFYFFELLNYLQHFKMMANLRKTTMGHITQEHLKQSKIVIPPMTLIENIDKKINPIFEKKLLLEQETQHLTQLRDFLLPMLMNGQARVT